MFTLVYFNSGFYNFNIFIIWRDYMYSSIRKNYLKLNIILVFLYVLSACSLLPNSSEVTKNKSKNITNYSFPSLSISVSIDEINNSVNITVPFGTNLTKLVASFSTSGVSIKIGSILQISSVTQNDFTNPVTYTVTAEDGSTRNYKVTVITAAASMNADLSSMNPIAQSPGSFYANPSPNFSPSVTSYTAGLNGGDIVSFTPVASDTHAVITSVTYQPVDGVSTPTEVSSVGGVYECIIGGAQYTEVKITIRAEDGVTTKSYTITIGIPW
jgi:trimeric autotransporter adhesin